MGGLDGDGRDQIMFQAVGRFPIPAEPAQDDRRILKAYPKRALTLSGEAVKPMKIDSPPKGQAPFRIDSYRLDSKHTAVF